MLCSVGSYLTACIRPTGNPLRPADDCKMRAALLFAAATASAFAARPKFAQEWSSFIISDLVQNQGSYSLPNGDLCCSEGSMDCQIQIQSQGGMVYNSLSRNATTQVFGADYQPYAIVTLYNLNKEIAVDQNFNCQSFCPNGQEIMSASPSGCLSSVARSCNRPIRGAA